MAYYLNICRDDQNKSFLLISEQHLDAQLPEIKAQIYFEAPVSALDSTTLNIVSYPIAKKEVEILLNLAQKRETKGVRSQGLFADGKVDKGNPFSVFSYPSVQDINELLAAINLQSPNSERYGTRKIQPDLDHVLENKRRIFWQNHLELQPREKLDAAKWTELEIKEANILNDFNVIRLILNAG